MQFIVFVLLKVIDIYSFIILAYAFLSWVPDLYDTSIGRIITSLVNPILRPFRRLRLQFFGLDFTVWVVFLLLNVATRFLLQLL